VHAGSKQSQPKSERSWETLGFKKKKYVFDPSWVETNIFLNFQQTETSAVHGVDGWLELIHL